MPAVFTVLTEIFVDCHDNLKGLGKAINAVFTKTKQQLWIVHQIRNFTKFVQYKAESKSVPISRKFTVW